MIDVQLLQLQYEILNVSIESLARSADLPVALLEREVEKAKWTRLWPDEDEPTVEIAEGEDAFTISSDRYIEKLRKRLTAYSLAKEILLTSRYLALEAGIIDKANEALLSIDSTTTSGIKALSSVFRDMSKGMSAGSLSLQQSLDDKGLPTVIIKDLSGRER